MLNSNAPNHVKFLGGVARKRRRRCAGNPDRLTYGIDSYGNVCGADNSAAGGPDLRAQTKLYYLNPLDLLQPSLAFLAARSVCVAACPGASDQCAVAALPCAADHEYRRDTDP